MSKPKLKALAGMGKELENKKNQTSMKRLCAQDCKFGDKIKQDHSHKTGRRQTLNKYA